MKQHTKLLLALVLGIGAGIAAHPWAENAHLLFLNTNFLQPVGQIFLRLIFMVVVPMIVSALILGVYELGRGHGLGAVAKKTLLYTILASTSSVLIGIALVNFFRPGRGFQVDASLLAGNSSAVATFQTNAAAAKTTAQSLIDLIPKNPLVAMTQALDGEMLAVMVFALIFGVALSLVNANRAEDDPGHLVPLLQEVYDVAMKVVGFAMKLAPYGVFAIVFNTAFKFGATIFLSLFHYVGIVVLGLLIQQFVVYSLMLRTLGRRSPWEFFKNCREVYLYAFSTSSSNATLPRALDAAENKLGLPPQISRFVLTVGATANQNGTALFEGITVLFLAQVYGIDLSVAAQFKVVLLSILAGIGTAGVPGGSLPMIMILCQSVGIPAEGIGLVLGVDRFLDMCRTTLNVSGDLVIAGLVSGPPQSAVPNAATPAPGKKVALPA